MFSHVMQTVTQKDRVSYDSLEIEISLYHERTLKL